jgi:hypothetical protein
MRRGTEAGTVSAAHRAADAISGALLRCKTVEGAVASYARGGGCSWSPAAKRVSYYYRLRARLGAELAAASAR